MTGNAVHAHCVISINSGRFGLGQRSLSRRRHSRRAVRLHLIRDPEAGLARLAEILAS